jgi:hypothetical protein
MSKLKTLKRLQSVRERVRDVSAARASVAQRDVAAANAAVDAAVDAHTQRNQAPPIRSTRAIDWLGFADEIGRLREYIDFTEDERKKALARAQIAQKELAEKERSLRTCERQIEVTRADISDRQLQSEQRLADDLSGSRGQ